MTNEASSTIKIGKTTYTIMSNIVVKDKHCNLVCWAEGKRGAVKIVKCSPCGPGRLYYRAKITSYTRDMVRRGETCIWGEEARSIGQQLNAAYEAGGDA